MLTAVFPLSTKTAGSPALHLRGVGLGTSARFPGGRRILEGVRSRMSVEALPPIVERPRWRRPGFLEIGLGVVVFIAGLADALIPDEIARLPYSLRWRLFVGPLLATLIWVSRMVYREVAAVQRRVREYPKLYAVAERERRRADSERARVHEATRALISLVLHPERIHAVSFEMVESVVSDEGVLLAIVAAKNLTSDPGNPLTVVDPQDGKWLGDSKRRNCARSMASA